MISELKSLREPGEHVHILIVADKNPKSAINPNIPLVGSKAYKKLLTWLADMHVNTYNLRIVSIADELAHLDVLTYESSNGAIVALGDNVATYLEDNGVYSFFKLPDPNKKAERKALKGLLNECKVYIYSK